MIDWSKLKTYEGYKYRSFEELCYQIAKGIYEERGCFTFIDDSGGGDGVEFYLTFPSGDQWGWQSKFYYPNPRLKESNRKRPIVHSLKKACQEHPQLKKWILCTPSNLTKTERDWFETTLPQSIPHDMGVALEHWGKSDFNAWLSEPRFAGKLSYFFGELELDMNWFKTQFDKEKVSVGEKFCSSLHTESIVDACIHVLLTDEKFVPQFAEWIEKIKEALPDLNDAISNLKHPTPKDIQWTEEAKCKVIKSAESLKTSLTDTVSQLEQAKKLLNEKRLSEAQAIDWESVLNQLREALKTHRTVGNEHGTSKIRYTGKEEKEFRSINEVTSTVHYPSSLIANLLDDFLYYALKGCKRINHSELNILGEAGVGKTHIACNICDERLNTGVPALFVRGIRFTSDRPIEDQLRSILDLPSSYSWNDFLQALSATAEAHHTRIPLVIDGLNESTHNGAFSNVWRLGLKGLVQEIEQFKNLVLITTCRTSYTEAIWGNDDAPNVVYSYGFDTDDELEEAVIKYFNEYKIKADLTAAPLAQFKHPIYLKIFCETQNPTKDTEKNIYVGEQTLFEVFDKYLKQCNRTVCDHLGLHPKTSIIQPVLTKIAEYFWEHRSRHIPLDELVLIVDGQSREQLDWLKSKTHAIESEGILVYRDWSEVGEAMYFTYDLLGGYLIAQYLLQKASDDVHCFLNRKDTVAALFSEDYETLHLMYSDIRRCLAALLPRETGKFLHNHSGHATAINLSIRAFFEISPKYINSHCTNLITQLFETHQNREPLLALAQKTIGHANHPFNASFWSERLMELPMAERDTSWTEYIRQNVESCERTLMRFETSCQSNQQLSDISKKRLRLLAEHIMWLLTSTVRALRDKATRALYWYGRRAPQQFFDLVLKSLSINDPYVPERMLAATYGIAMARHYDFEDAGFANDVLPLYGRKLYETMFKPGAPYSTTHILARDYARRTIDIALIHHPGLLTDDERKRNTPPFTDGGIREWGESEDRNADEYRDGNAPVQMDFANYTLGGLVGNRRNYDSEPSEYKRVQANIFWRMYDLGYSLDNFGDIDKAISRASWTFDRLPNGGKTDRYGKKYSWIAFFELAGLRQDTNLLPDYYDDVRISDADIDPSFPDKMPEHILVDEDFLGDRQQTAKEWISTSAPPDLTCCLSINRLCGEQGTWVLLDGSLSQKDEQVSRSMLIALQGLIVKSENLAEIVERTEHARINVWNVPSFPRDHYTYAGEIPWCDTYPENDWQELSIEVESALVSKKRIVLPSSGAPSSENKVREFCDNLAHISRDKELETKEMPLRQETPELTWETVEVEEKRYKKFQILSPVRMTNWEDYHSAVVAGRNIAMPSRQIAGTFGLCGQPQRYDLFEQDGRRASIVIGHGEEWPEMQRFTYLREDLLERHLEEINGELIWVIWGSRCLLSQDKDAPSDRFQYVRVYSQM